MEAQTIPEPQNIVEHMRNLIQVFHKGEIDDALPDMAVELFYNFVDQTLSTSQNINLVRGQNDPSVDQTIIRHEDLVKAERIYFNSNSVFSSMIPTPEKANIVNAEQNIGISDNFELEFAQPPLGASLEGVNFQVPKRTNNPQQQNKMGMY